MIFATIQWNNPRLTLINISDVHNWFDPAIDIKWGKDVCVLLVFSEKHVRGDDIDDEHCFERDISYPKACVDGKICEWLAELFFDVYGQNLTVCDCLEARWGEASQLAHWSCQSILTPLAPDSTAFMAEPDTH